MVKWCHKKYLDRFSSFFCFEKKIIKYTSVSEFEDKQNNFKFNFFANFSALSNMALGAKKCTTNNLEDIIFVYCVWYTPLESPGDWTLGGIQFMYVCMYITN